jgi:hypothetical protein
MRLRVVGVEPLGLGIDDGVARPIRVRVEEIDPVSRDHELPAEQQSRPDAEDQADKSLGRYSVPLI